MSARFHLSLCAKCILFTASTTFYTPPTSRPVHLPCFPTQFSPSPPEALSSSFGTRLRLPLCRKEVPQVAPPLSHQTGKCSILTITQSTSNAISAFIMCNNSLTGYALAIHVQRRNCKYVDFALFVFLSFLKVLFVPYFCSVCCWDTAVSPLRENKQFCSFIFIALLSFQAGSRCFRTARRRL